MGGLCRTKNAGSLEIKRSLNAHDPVTSWCRFIETTVSIIHANRAYILFIEKIIDASVLGERPIVIALTELSAHAKDGVLVNASAISVIHIYLAVVAHFQCSLETDRLVFPR